MKINPGPKGLIPWSEVEKAEGLRLSQDGLSPIEVYSCLMIERIKRYEAALTEIANGKMADYRNVAKSALELSSAETP